MQISILLQRTVGQSFRGFPLSTSPRNGANDREPKDTCSQIGQLAAQCDTGAHFTISWSIMQEGMVMP